MSCIPIYYVYLLPITFLFCKIFVQIVSKYFTLSWWK